MHYNPWIMPAALDFLVRTKDKYPLSKVVSHSFPLSDVNKAFEIRGVAGQEHRYRRDARHPQAVIQS